jgi:MYXO-CTERM domain-containing protein
MLGSALRAFAAPLVLASCFGALGCIAAAPESQDEPVGQADEAIKGGYTDEGDTSVVGIATLQGGGVGLCSGSLIAPNLVLTARHCVAPVLSEVNGGVSCSTTHFGANYAASVFYVTTKTQITQNPDDYVHVSEVITPPDSDKLCGVDEALLILDKPMDPAVTTPLVPRVDTPLVAGEQYFAVGYGGTQDDGSGAGTRRRRDDLFINCVADDCPAYAVKPTEWMGDTGICEGDSGGPALDLQNRVIGVTSRGGAGCTSPVYGYVFGWAQWIKDNAVHAAEVGGYDAPPWAKGAPTDPVFSLPVGDACTQPSDCASNACLDGYCTRPCNDLAACPDGYTCNAEGFCQQPQPEPPKKSKPKSSDASNETTVSCSVRSPSADPTKPIPWLTGFAFAGALALARRRRRR